MNKNDQLEAKYGLALTVAMVVGIVVGIGIFFKSEAILSAAHLNPKVALTAWIVGGVITILAGLSAAEISSCIPETGGLVSYIGRIYGDLAGFMTGWMHVVLYLPGLTAVLAYYTGFFATIFLGIEQSPTNVAMIAIPVFISVFALNLFKPKVGGNLQTFITVIKTIPLLSILILGFTKGTNITPLATSVEAAPFTFGLVLTALVPVMFAYDGWILACSIGGEIKNPKKNLPKAIILGLGLIVLLYIGLNVALLHILPADVLAKEGTVGAVVSLVGPRAVKLIFGGIVISAYGTLNGLSLASIRFPFTLSTLSSFPMKEVFGKVSPKFGTPLNSGILMFIISLVYLIIPFVTGISIDIFGDLPVAIIWAFYGAMFIGLIILRKKQPDLKREYKVPFYPIIPILAAIGGFGIAISAAVNNPYYMLYSLIIISTGFPVYKKLVK